MKALKIKSVQCFGVNWIPFGGRQCKSVEGIFLSEENRNDFEIHVLPYPKSEVFFQSYQARPLVLRHFSGRNNWCIIIPLKLEAAFFQPLFFYASPVLRNIDGGLRRPSSSLIFHGFNFLWHCHGHKIPR